MSSPQGIDVSGLDQRTRNAVFKLQRMISSRYPGTTYQLVRSPDDPGSLHLLAVADVDDPDEVGDLVVERVVELLVAGVRLHVIPMRRPKRFETESATGHKPIVNQEGAQHDEDQTGRSKS